MSTMIPMLDPQGKARMIPMDQVEAAKSAGGKVARKFLAPDGTKRWIPADQTDAAVKAGGKPVPIGVEDSHPEGSAVSRFISSAGSAIGGIVKSIIPQNADEAKTRIEEIIYPPLMVKHDIVDPAIEQGKQAAAEFRQSNPTSTRPTATELEHRQKALGHGLAAVVPGVGPWAAQVGEQVGTQIGEGDVAGGLGTLGGNAAVYAATEAGAKYAGPLARKLGNISETFRKGTQTVLGGGERQVAAETGKVAEAQKTADNAHQEQSFGAVQDTKGRELQYQQDARAAERDAALANKAVEEHNRAKLKEHDAGLDAAAKQNLKNHIQHLSDEAEIAKQNAIKSQEVVNKNRAEHQRYETELAEAQRKNTAAHVQHQAETAEAENANAAARAIPDSRAGLESLANDKTAEADVRTENARKNAQIEGNRLYKEPNEILNPVEANAEAVTKATLKARQTLKGSDTNLPIVNEIDEKLKDMRDHGKPLVYKDIAGFISELGAATSKGGLPGDVWTAYDNLHEALQDEAKTLALEYDRDHGMEPTVKRKPAMPNQKGEMEPGEHYTVPHPNGIAAKVDAARAYWRRMKQTFGKPYNKVPGRAGEAVYDANPDYEEGKKTEYSHRLLDSFDPEISKLLKEASDAKDRASKLSEGSRPTAKTPKAPEEITVKPPKIEKAPEPTPPPDRPKEVEAPDAPNLKTPVETQYPKQPERVPVDDRPAQEEVNTRQLRENLIRDKLATWTNVTRFQMTRLVAGPLGTLVAAVTGHPGLEAAGAVYTAGELSPFVLQKMMDRPGFREWITRPPADELETLKNIPDADRIKIYDGLNKAVRQAQKQGIKVDPRLAALVGAGAATVAGPRTQELQQMRRQATEIMHESSDAELPPQIQRIEDGLKVRYVKGQPYGNAIASVGEHDPRTIVVNDVDRFNKGPLQTRGHEIVHLWRNNLPGPIQKMAMPDNASDPYNISKIDDLRAKGYNLATIPQEMAATIVQTYIADPSQRKKLQPWIDDMDKIPMSVVEGTDPGQKGINTAPRPPMPPTESYRQLKAISARYR